MRRLAVFTLFVSLAAGVAVPLSAATDSAEIQALKRAAQSMLNAGDYSAAEVYLRRALTRADATQIATIVEIRVALAELLREEGRGEEARQIYRTILLSDNVPPSLRYQSLAGLADIDGIQGQTEPSVREWDEAISLAREIGQPLLEADALRGESLAWLEVRNSSRAEPLLRRALSIQDADPAARPWSVAATLTVMAKCYRQQDKLALAEDALTRALELERGVFGAAHPQVAFVMERLAEIYAQRGSFAQARDYSDRAIAAMQSCCGAESPAMAAALVNRADIEFRAKAPEAAAANYSAALRIAQSSPSSAALERKIISYYVPVLKVLHRGREVRELTALARSSSGINGESRTQGTR